MQTPVGPSLRVMLALGESLTGIAAAALEEVWDRWIGPECFERRIARLERAGLVERHREAGDTARVVRLTETGRIAALGGRDSDVWWRRSWDGRWRMVLFDVRESERTVRIRLQRRLRGMHFGYLQDSVWVCPDPVDSLRRAIGEIGADCAVLACMEARPCGGETDADIVSGAWNFTQINRCYDDYIGILRSRLRMGGRLARRDWLRAEWSAWSRAVRADPLLPEVLLPDGYRGRQAWALRQEVFSQRLTSG